MEYENFLDYDSFAVRIAEKDMPDMIDILKVLTRALMLPLFSKRRVAITSREKCSTKGCHSLFQNVHIVEETMTPCILLFLQTVKFSRIHSMLDKDIPSTDSVVMYVYAFVLPRAVRVVLCFGPCRRSQRRGCNRC